MHCEVRMITAYLLLDATIKNNFGCYCIKDMNVHIFMKKTYQDKLINKQSTHIE